MFKKLMWSTAGLTALGVFVFGDDAWSYLSTTVSSVRSAVKQEVPLEFEVQRARDLVAQVDGEVGRCLRIIAEDEVGVEELRRDLADKTLEHASQKDNILQLRNDLQTPRETYIYSGKAYTQVEVQQDLAERFRRYQLVEETLQSRREALNAREKALAAARKKLETMLDSKEQLQVQIENLDARLKTLQAAQVASHVAVDESQVARTRQLIRELNKQVDVRQKLLQGQGDTTGLIPLNEPAATATDITQQIDRYFSPQVGQLPADAGGTPQPASAENAAQVAATET